MRQMFVGFFLFIVKEEIKYFRAWLIEIIKYLCARAWVGEKEYKAPKFGFTFHHIHGVCWYIFLNTHYIILMPMWIAANVFAWIQAIKNPQQKQYDNKQTSEQANERCCINSFRPFVCSLRLFV